MEVEKTKEKVSSLVYSINKSKVNKTDSIFKIVLS